MITEIPSNQISPGVFGQISKVVDATTLSQVPYQVLAIGQKIDAGSQPALQVVQVESIEDAKAKFGTGSHLHNMAEVYFNTEPVFPMFAIALDDAEASASATGTVTVTGTATGNGTYKLYLGGVDSKRMVSVGILTGDTAEEVATAITSAITANTSLPVTASATSGVVTITAKNKGTLGNNIRIVERFNDDDTAVAGITTTVVDMANGATDPDIQTALDAIPEESWFQYLVGGYTASTDIANIENYLSARFVATYAKSGMYQTALNSVSGISELTSYGDGRNSAHSSVFGTYKNPCLPWDIATAVVAKVMPLIATRATYNTSDILLDFVVASRAENLFNNSERNQLLHNGVSALTATVDGKAKINKHITTYQLNDAGAVDDHYRDMQSFYTMQYLRYDLVSFLKSGFANYNVVDNGTKYGKTASNVTTPAAIETSVQNRCILWGNSVLIEDVDKTIEGVSASRNGNNRVDINLVVNIAGKLEIIGFNLGFKA